MPTKSGFCGSNATFEVSVAAICVEGALSSDTGISLLIGRPWPEGGYALVAGSQSWPQGVLVSKNVAAIAPREWQVVRVDLWTSFHEKPVRIQALNLAATGGGAAFDQILLGRTEQELTRVPRSTP